MSRTKLRTPDQEQALYSYLSVPAVAERLQCTQAHVVNLITAGEDGRRLRAIDISTTGRQRTYRVRPEWLEEFEAAREVHAP